MCNVDNRTDANGRLCQTHNKMSTTGCKQKQNKQKTNILAVRRTVGEAGGRRRHWQRRAERPRRRLPNLDHRTAQ
jgi:hypothetical protein